MNCQQPAGALPTLTPRMSIDELLGREREWAAIRRFLDAATTLPRRFVVEGPAGIGKSALLRATALEAERHGHTVLRCCGTNAEARWSFVGLHDLVGQYLDDASIALPAPQREALDVALCRRPGLDTAADPKAVGIALWTMLSLFAAHRPVVVIADDADWLDGATGAALRFVARRVGDERLSMLVAVRTPAGNDDPLGFRETTHPATERLCLGPLAADFVVRIIDTHFPGRFTRPVARRIADAAAGNTLHALDIASAIDPDALIGPNDQLPVPTTVDALVRRRVDTMSNDAREALLAVAYLAQPTIDLVERASTEVGVVEAQASGLLTSDRRRIGFFHPLHAAAVAAMTPTRLRQQMHRRLADLVPDAEARVRHRALGAPGPDDAVAGDLCDVAEAARRRGAWTSAAELFEQGLELTPADQTVDRDRRAVAAARSHFQAGDIPLSRQLIERSLNSMGPGPLRSDALRLLGEILANDVGFGEAIAIYQRAMVDARTPDQRALIDIDLAYLQLHLGNAAAAVRHARQAVDGLERAADPRFGGVHAEALAALVKARAVAGGGIDWELLERALELEDRESMRSLHLRPSLVAGRMHMTAGQFAEARVLLSRHVADAMEGRDAVDGPCFLSWVAWMEAQNGELDRALECHRSAERTLSSPGNRATWPTVLMHGVLVKGLRGDVDGARADARDCRALASELGDVRSARYVAAAEAQLELSLADPGGAIAAASDVLEAVSASGIGDPGQFAAVPELVMALVSVGELDRATDLSTAWDQVAEETDLAWALAVAARGRAAIAAARGDRTAAEVALSDALVEHKRVDMPIELGRTLLVQGQVHRQLKQKADSRESLQQALALFESTGASIWAQRANDELARLGTRRRPGELSATEARVAELVAAGRTNRQVAAALFMSPKTVETHVTRIFRTLGLETRGQLAAAWRAPNPVSGDISD